MRTKKIIALLLLTVYTIVVAHSIIPHHHHSENSETATCQNHEHECCNDHESANKVEDHSHDHDPHLYCSFSDDILRTDPLSLSDVFLPENPIVITPKRTNVQSKSDFYIVPVSEEPQCRDVQLRAPPSPFIT